MYLFPSTKPEKHLIGHISVKIKDLQTGGKQAIGNILDFNIIYSNCYSTIRLLQYSELLQYTTALILQNFLFNTFNELSTKFYWVSTRTYFLG